MNAGRRQRTRAAIILAATRYLLARRGRSTPPSTIRRRPVRRCAPPSRGSGRLADRRAVGLSRGQRALPPPPPESRATRPAVSSCCPRLRAGRNESRDRSTPAVGGGGGVGVAVVRRRRRRRCRDRPAAALGVASARSGLVWAAPPPRPAPRRPAHRHQSCVSSVAPRIFAHNVENPYSAWAHSVARQHSQYMQQMGVDGAMLSAGRLELRQPLPGGERLYISNPRSATLRFGLWEVQHSSLSPASGRPTAPRSWCTMRALARGRLPPARRPVEFPDQILRRRGLL